MKYQHTLIIYLLFCSISTWGQEITISHEGYGLTVSKDIQVTPVKNQGKTGTCWSFSTTSFIESEALRMNKGQHDLSEMYFVRQVYPTKADNYVRRHGNATFGAGGLSHDIMTAASRYGMMPESAYSGLPKGSLSHNHGELHNLLEGMVKNVVENKSGTLNPSWKQAYNAILDNYLGPVPDTFEYHGKTLSSQQFVSQELGFEPNNYFEFTSFQHHPYYKPFVLEIPDNWSNGMYYNLPLDELQRLLDHALDQGFTVVWDGDVSEKEFSHKNGIAIVPEKTWGNKSATERARSFMTYEPEIVVTPSIRQEAFDSYATTDDHLMHIVGKVTDARGIKYYLTKNSWGSESQMGGYLFMSESYIRLKTVAILVHKKAVPNNMAEAIGL